MGLAKLTLYFFVAPGFAVGFSAAMTEHYFVGLDQYARWKPITIKNLVRSVVIGLAIGSLLGVVGLAAGTLDALLK
jgi:hypothetical protein